MTTERTFVDPFDPQGRVLKPWKNDPNATPRVLDDEATLLRSHGLSIGARREQRRPVPLKVDELGWGNDGRWHPEFDGSAA